MTVEEFANCRFITVLTPESFGQSHIVVSTVFSKEKLGGETAVAYPFATGSQTINYNKLDWEKLATQHRTLLEAVKYHNDFVKTRKLSNCKGEEREVSMFDVLHALGEMKEDIDSEDYNG